MSRVESHGGRPRITSTNDPENPDRDCGGPNYRDSPQRRALSWANFGVIRSALHLSDGLRASRRQDSAWSWVVCVSACFVEAIVVGIHHIYGVFFAAFLDVFHETRFKTALCGSLSYGLGMLVSPLASALVVRFGCRRIAIFGSLFSSFALFSASFVDNLGLLFLAYGVLFGIGSSFAFTTSQIVIGWYFDKHRSLAAGIVAAAPCVATLALAPFTQLVISEQGWQTAFRLLCVLLLLTVLGEFTYNPIACPAPEPSHDSAVEGTDPTDEPAQTASPAWRHHLELIKDPVFVVWVMSIAFYLLGAFIPFIHIIRLAEDRGYSANDGTILLTLLSISTAIGRLLFGRISDLVSHHRRHMQQVCMVCIGLVTMLIPVSTSFVSMACFCVVRGLFDGCVIVMMPVMTMDIVGREKMTVAWGLLFGVASVFFCAGPSLSGLIFDMTKTYNVVFYVGGFPAIIASMLLSLMPCSVRRSTAFLRTEHSSTVLKMLPIPIVASELAMYRVYDPAPSPASSSSDDEDVLFHIGSTPVLNVSPHQVHGDKGTHWTAEECELGPVQGPQCDGAVRDETTATVPRSDSIPRKKYPNAHRVRRESECQSEFGCQTPPEIASSHDDDPTTVLNPQPCAYNIQEPPSSSSLNSRPTTKYPGQTPRASRSASCTTECPASRDGNSRGDTRRPAGPTNEFFHQLNVRLDELSNTQVGPISTRPSPSLQGGTHRQTI